MSQANAPPNADAFLRTIRIVAGALVAASVVVVGVLAFLAARPEAPVDAAAGGGAGAGAGAEDRPAPEDEMPLITIVALVVGVTNGMLAMIVPPRTTARALARQGLSSGTGAAEPGFEGWGPDAPRLFSLYQTEMILRFALLEGAAFLNGMAYFLEGNVLALAMAGGLIALMLIFFPMAERIRQWMEACRNSGVV